MNQFHVTPLHLAVMKKNYEIIELLLNHKDINIDEKNEISCTI